MPKEIHWSKLDVGRYRINWLFLTLLIIALSIALLVQPETVEKQPSICLIKGVTGKDCLGCGMIRAFVCAVHGQFGKAYDHNRLCIIIIPLLGYIAMRGVVRRIPIARTIA